MELREQISKSSVEIGPGTHRVAVSCDGCLRQMDFEGKPTAGPFTYNPADTNPSFQKIPTFWNRAEAVRIAELAGWNMKDGHRCPACAKGTIQ